MMRENDGITQDNRFKHLISKFSLDNNLYIGTSSDLIVINFQNFGATSHNFERIPDIIHIDICWKNNVIVFISKSKGVYFYHTKSSNLIAK